MKIKIYSGDLINAITKAEKFLVGKPSLSILKNIHLTAKNNQIKLIAKYTKDPIVTLIVNVPGEIITEGETLIHKDNFKLIKKITGDVVISYENEQIVFQSSKKLTFKSANPEDYPLVDLEGYNNFAFNVNAGDFKSALKIKSMASNDTIRPQLNTINICGNRFMACDGYRLAVCRLDIENACQDDMMIPLYSVELLDKIINKKDDDILSFSYKVYNGNIVGLVIVGKDWMFITPTERGQYINVDSILNQDYKIITKINSNVVLETLDFTREIKQVDKYNPIPFVMTITRDKIEILKEDAMQKVEDVWQANSAFNTGITSLRIGFNDDYLMDAIKCINTDTIMFKFTENPNSPALITNLDETEQHLILPVRLKQG